MSRRQPRPAAVEVFLERLHDDTTHSDVTVRGWVVAAADGTLAPFWNVRSGPGVGPHAFRDLALGRKVGWAVQHCIDALRAHTGVPETAPDPQMSLADAPLEPGHHPTIRVGALT